jgi:putative PIN family toxin of toxin-antitoxin system
LFDTNIFISAILFGGLPSVLLDKAVAGLIQLVTSPVLLDELEGKLRHKFKWTEQKISETRLELENLCEVVSTVESLHIIKDDPDDDRVLECAVAGRADYIISGDKHLLRLGEFRGIRILTIRQFMDLIAPPA